MAFAQHMHTHYCPFPYPCLRTSVSAYAPTIHLLLLGAPAYLVRPHPFHLPITSPFFFYEPTIHHYYLHLLHHHHHPSLSQTTAPHPIPSSSSLTPHLRTRAKDHRSPSLFCVTLFSSSYLRRA
ncbi:uncharacterized protein DS421_15g499250 [Arachis hypogaea]|nr:uncharacterized protein DS421_15g499250 [Arachis hypogaea]